jgi:TPR repeat protein
MDHVYLTLRIFILSLHLYSCGHPDTNKEQQPCHKGEECFEEGLRKFSTLSKAKNSQQAAQVFEEAALLFKTGCGLKHPASCFELARYHKARHNIEASLALFNQACKLGHKKACHFLKFPDKKK